MNIKKAFEERKNSAVRFVTWICLSTGVFFVNCSIRSSKYGNPADCKVYEDDEIKVYVCEDDEIKAYVCEDDEIHADSKHRSMPAQQTSRMVH